MYSGLFFFLSPWKICLKDTVEEPPRWAVEASFAGDLWRHRESQDSEPQQGPALWMEGSRVGQDSHLGAPSSRLDPVLLIGKIPPTLPISRHSAHIPGQNWKRFGFPSLVN